MVGGRREIKKSTVYSANTIAVTDNRRRRTIAIKLNVQTADDETSENLTATDTPPH